MSQGPQFPGMYDAAAQFGQYLAQQPGGFQPPPDFNFQMDPNQFGGDPNQFGINGGQFSLGPTGGADSDGMQGMGMQGMPQGGMPQGMPMDQAQPDQGGGFWQHMGQYLGSQEGQDALMRGAIGILAGTNPVAALQIATNYRQHIDQRNWQAQQNELQRTATQENIKLRSDYMQQQKEQAQNRTLAYKIDQSRKDIAALGQEPPPVPEDESAWPAYFEDLRTHYADAQKQDREKKDYEKKRQRGFGEAYKTGVVADEFSDDPMVQAAAEVGQDRIDRANERLQLQKDREEQLKKLRADKATMADVKLRAQRLNAKLKRAETDIAHYEDRIGKIENNGIYPFLPADSAQRATFDAMIKQIQGQIDKVTEKRDALDEEWDSLADLRGEPSPKDIGPKDVTPGGDDDVNSESRINEEQLPPDIKAQVDAAKGTNGKFKVVVPPGPERDALMRRNGMMPPTPEDEANYQRFLKLPNGINRAQAAWFERFGQPHP